jgi:membrane-associated protease RseP (regulator of RpoE activity)
MAGNFSKSPGDALADALSKTYAAVHVEQGVPVLDRDVNLLGDLIAATLRQVLQRHIGDGCAGTTDFAISANGDPLDFAIAPGTYLASGFSVTLAAAATYKTQTVTGAANPPGPLPPLTQPTPAQPNPRIDTVYLDCWLDEIDDSQDPTLGNPLDVGVRTSTRARPNFLVRVAENATAAPTPPAGHVYSPLASFSRPQAGGLTAAEITDLRASGLSVAGLLARVNALDSLLAPSITSFSPEHVIAGQPAPVTIIGQNFAVGAATVLFGATQGVIDPANSNATTLTVHVPATAASGAGQVVVVKNAVSSATAADTMTIDPAATPPKFTAGNEFTPTHAGAGATVTLNGSNFAGINRVTFNTPGPASALPGGDLISATANAVTVKVPAALTAGQSGTITVSIDGAPTMTATSAGQFTVDAAAPPPTPPSFGPVGSQFSPQTQTHGGQITLAGNNFGTSAATTQVSFTGTNTVPALASDIVSVSQTQIVVKVPAALTVAVTPNNTATITVTVNGQSITSNDKLKVV